MVDVHITDKNITEWYKNNLGQKNKYSYQHAAHFVTWTFTAVGGYSSEPAGMTNPSSLSSQAANYLRKASSRAEAERFHQTTQSLVNLSQPSAMASRRLALNLSRGLRSRAGLSTSGLWKRGFATASALGKTQTTTLKNGLTVSTPSPALRPGLTPGQLASQGPGMTSY